MVVVRGQRKREWEVICLTDKVLLGQDGNVLKPGTVEVV